MAISEDTAALVAAQLTAAWAAHVEPINGHGAAEQQVLDTYRRLHAAVTGADDDPVDTRPFIG